MASNAAQRGAAGTRAKASLATTALALAVSACLAGPAWADNFQVTHTGDSGAGSLRRAIENANDRGGFDGVVFDIPGGGPHTISPSSPLPPITDPIKIAGYSQPGASENTRSQGSDAVIKIELSGEDAGSGADGLVLNGGGSTVTGLAVNRFSGDGVQVNSRTNVVIGSHIGTDPSGEQDLGNGVGVRIRDAALNKVGEGTTTHNRTVVSGNGAGVVIAGSGAVDNRVINSYIGVDADGNEDLGNSGIGVAVEGARSSDISTGITSLVNVISGNDGDGVRVVGGTDTRVSNNYIGTDAIGKADLGNRLNGIRVINSPNNLIGDGEQACGSCWDGKPQFGAGNIVSGNDEAGVVVEGKGSRGNRVLNSQIGTDRTRTRNVGNRTYGVSLVAGARDNFVGGVRREEWEMNEIAFNGRGGVMVASGATGNAIFSNSVFSNQRMGIDLSADGLTRNDARDRDTGPNGLQNYPVLSSASRSGSKTTIRGSLGSTPNTDITVQFFTSPSAGPSGYGEGKRLLGKVHVRTNGSGSVGLSYATSGAPSGHVVSATATPGRFQSASGPTSEFSRAITVR